MLKWSQMGAACYYCGVELIDTHDSSNPAQRTKDHLVPRSKGGSNSPDNIVPCCRWCNCRKRTLSVGEFRFAEAKRREGWPKFTADQERWLALHGFIFPTLPVIIFVGER